MPVLARPLQSQSRCTPGDQHWLVRAQKPTFQTISGMSRDCVTASSKMARTRSKSSTAPSTWVHWIHAELRDGSYCMISFARSLAVIAYRQELFVQRPDSVKLSQAHLELDIASEELGLWAHADTDTEDLSSSCHVLATDLKVCVREP